LRKVRPTGPGRLPENSRKRYGVADIFNEVDEELRADQARLFWKKYGNVVIGGALVVVLAAAVWWGWQLYTTRRQQQQSVDYIEAIQALQKDGKDTAKLDVIAGQNNGYSALARFQLATRAAADDPAKAADLLSAVSQDTKIDGAMRGMAAIQAGQLKLKAGKPQDAIQVVQPFTAAGNAYRLSALEITGVGQIAAGDKAKAKETFTQLQQLATSPTDASPSVALRAQEMLDRLQ
jgi:hypothetical protein